MTVKPKMGLTGSGTPEATSARSGRGSPRGDGCREYGWWPQGQDPTAGSLRRNPGRGVLREIRLQVSSGKLGGAEILKSVLVSCGVPPEGLVELTQEGHHYILFYPKTSVQARRVITALRKIRARGVRPETRFLFRKDWQDRWKKDLKPFALGRNFYVIPTGWSSEYPAGSRTPIVLDTAMAFGSGLHETTQFMVELIELCASEAESFLDIGTGTGILAIAAAKCGVKEVHAIDFNPDCVRVARANLRRNGCRASSLKAADIHRYPPRRQCDFVAANLVTHNLIQAGRKLVSLVRAGKYLAVSGISLENVPVLKKAFRGYPLLLLKILRGKEWAALLYKKRG